MNNKNNFISKIILRCASICLMIFSILFGSTKKLTGYCMGDNILKSLGLKTWSNGTEGLHYTAIYAFVMLFIGFALFSITTKQKLKTFRYFMIGLTVVFLVSNFL